MNRKPVPIFFRVVLGVNFFYPVRLFMAALLPLRAGVALRWFVEVQPTMATLEVAATLAPVFAVPFAFLPFDPYAGDRFAGHRVLRLDADGLSLHGRHFPFLNLDIESLSLRIQPYRSMAIAGVVVSMTILLVQQLRTTNRNARSCMAKWHRRERFSST